MPTDSEKSAFETVCRQPHRKMTRCFMTGKACVYEEVIGRRLESIQAGETPLEGFMIMAFRPNLSAFYNWSLVRFFKSRYGADTEILKRADQVRRTGYVICEKICRRIQEAAFVAVDISVDNANVLYELGIAFGLRQKLLVLRNADSHATEALKAYLPDDLQPRIYAYPSIRPISPRESFSQRFYIPPESSFVESRYVSNPQVVILDLRAGDSEQGNTEREQDVQDDIELSFMDVVKGAVGVSIANIVEELSDPRMEGQLPSQYAGIIEKMKTAVEIGPTQDTRFDTIRSAIDQSFCVLLRTAGTHPFSYFWLGYCHATGKNVIPIFEIREPTGDVNDLAFDIRSLWHLVLVREDPTRILSELEEILRQMILTDFGEWSRRSFWSRIFGHSGRVSIFTGALHNPDFKREMVGDWDLRTASELMSYFSTHQLVATIESPIYQPEQVKVTPEEYRKQIGHLIEDRNAVVIASPDVNPLTELLLGRLFGVPDEKLFRQQFDSDSYPRAVAAVKRRKASKADPDPEAKTDVEAKADTEAKTVERFFFLEEESEEDSDGHVEKRGFRGNWLPGKELLLEYVGQTEIQDKDFELYAHLVVALNPCNNKNEHDAEEFVVILSGVSGPSTFALTQLLTGGMGGEFVDYNGVADVDLDSGEASRIFNAHAEAERILNEVTEGLSNIKRQSAFCGVQMIVKVTVGPSADPNEYLTFDSRRVKHWELVPDTLKLIEASKSTASRR